MATDIDEIVSGIVKEKSYSGNSDIQEIVSDMSKERDQSVSIVPSSVKVIPPNEAAKVLDLSGRFGIRSDIVARNLETLQTEKDNESAREFSLNYQYTPKTAEWLGENPYNAALTLDDIHGLMNIEKDIQDHGMIHNMIKGFGTTGMLQVANMALRAPGGAIDATLGAMRIPGVIGNVPLNAFESLTGVKVESPRFLLDNPATRWVDEMAAKTSPPEMSGDFWNEVKSGNLSRAGRILAVQAATNAPMSVALLAASVFGGPAGAGAGLATMGAGEAGTTSLEARNKGISTEKGQVAALLHGSAEVGGEYIGTILPFKQWGEAITRTYGKEVTKKVFSDMFKTIAYTHGEEGLGEGATQVVQDLTDYFSGINPNALDGIAGRAINASAVGFVSGPVTSAISLGSTIRQNIIDQKTAVLHKDFMTALGNSVESSKVKERLPEKMREVVERMTKDGPVENVYIDPGVVDEYFQGEKSDPIQFMQSIGALESYTDAKEHGGKIKIPLSVWAEKIIGTKAHIDLLNDTSFSPDTPSFNEAQETAKRLAKAEQEASSESGAFDDIRQDIISKLNKVGGFSPQEISAQADMMAKRVIRRASILDVDPVKLWNRRHFDIERSIFPTQNNVVSPPVMPTTQEIEERANLLMGIDKEQNQLNTEANRRWNDLLKGGIKEPPGMREEWLTLPLRRRNKNGEGLDIIKDKAIELGLMGPNDDIIKKIRSLKSTKKEKGIESYLSAAQSELVAEYEAFGHPSDRTPNTPIISLSEEAPFQGPVQGDLFGDSVGKVNPVVRYEDLYSTARKNGMDHPQARKYALDEMGQSIKKPSPSISNVQGEFGSTGGVSGFGSGRRGETDLFQDQTSPQSQENQTPIETAALSDLVARSQVLFPSLHSSYTEIIWKDPDFVKLTNDAISVIDKYLKDSTGSNGKTESIRVQSYLHDVMHKFAGAAKEKNSSLIEELTKQFPDLQNEFSAVYMANSSMAYPKDKWFDKYISNKWVDKLRPKVGIENDLKRANNRPLYQSGKPAFYSQLERVVEDKLPAKAPVSQVRNILNDQAIKRDEVEWSNVENFLAGKETVSKAELLDFLRENQVQVKDVVKGSTDLTHERLGWIKRGNVYRPSFEFGHKIGQIEHNQTDGDYTYTTPNGTTEDFSSLGSAKSAALEYARSIGFDDTKFSKYTLPGGENYREILLTIPDQVEMRGAKVAEKIRQLEAERAKINPTSTYDTASFDRIRAINQQIQNLEKTGLIQNGESGTFKSPHFSEPNILAHVRMNDRTTADGKRVLFLEEVQSDWHQKGREVGYKSNTAIDTKGWTAKKSEKSGWSVYDNNGNFVNGGITANSEKEAIQIIVSENLHIGLDKFKEDSAVPNAPFKKTWHELALKKVLRMAVEGGYDSISWTTGEQQAERYDLSKQVEALSYKKNDDGTFDVKAYRSGELPGINVGENITPNKLPDVVGKDVAAKMDQGTGKASRLEPWINLTGVDLKVGGEGMKGFYDKIIPDFLNKYTKKWGGRVQDALIRDYKKMEPGTWVVSDSRGNFAYGATTEAKAIAYAKREGIEGYTVHQVDANTAGLKIHALEITPTMREGIMAGQPLFQRGGNIPRARMVETSTRTLIQLFQNADLSSLIHELGHVYLKEMISDFQELTSRDAGTLNENQRQYIKDVETTLKYLGADSLSSLTTEQHELWARSFEAYLREGSAPSPELKAAFSRFRNWLIDVYRDIKGYLRGELNSEVRGVFDRLLASQEEITQADQTSGFETIFKSFEEAGMPESEAKNYARMVYDAKQAAEEDHLAKVMDQIKRENNKDWKDKRSVVESEITEKVNNIKTYVALSIMQNGTMPNGDEAPDGMKGVKLSKDALVQEFGESVLDRLPRPYIYSRVGGISAGDAAALFGYSDGTAFINDLAGAMPRREMIKQWTDSEMQARYGDKRTPEEKMDDAISSLHNDKRAQLLREELNYMVSDNFATFKKLVRRINKRVPTVEEVRSQAEKTIMVKKVSEIKPSTYSSAESRAGREAVSLMLKGDIQGAFDKKMTELYNHELFRAAKNAKDNIANIVDGVSRFERLDVRKQIGKTSQDILGMIDGLMDRYDFRKSTTLKEIEKRKQLIVWVEEQKAKQIPITIPDYVMDESRRVSYKDIPYQELLDVYKTIKILNHQSIVMAELLKSQDGRSFNEVKGELISTAVSNFDVKKKMAPLETGALDDTKEWVKNAMASHVKVETILEELDGDNPLGAFYKRIFSPLISARDAEWKLMEKTNNALRDIWSAYTKEERALWHYRRINIPGTDLKMTKPTILSFALNVGNEYNASALLEGLQLHQNPDWTNEKIMAVLNTLDERDISVINRIWGLIDSFWPDAKALEERVTGVAPEKVKAKSVTLSNGVLNGGYYPIKFNSKHDWRVWAWEEERNIKAMASPPTARAMTAHGSMIERKGTGGRLLRTDLSVISEHLQDVIHDITHREAVLDVNKIIQDDDIRNVIINSIGREKYNQLGPWIKSIAGERSQGDLAWLERLASRARSGMTTVALGFKVSSGLMQLNGYSNTVKMIGKKYAYRGLQKIGQNGFDLKGLWEKISSESNDMKYRLSTFDRDVRDNLKKSNIIAKRKGVLSVSDVYMAEIEKYYFSIIGLNDLAISVPTYLGAKEKAMDGNVKGIKAGNEKAAIAYAEKIVRTTQSANSVMDLAAVQRGGELQKLFTMFYSQMNIQFNQWMRVAQNVKRTGNFKEIFAAVFYLAFIPAVCKDIIYGGDEDKEWWKRIGKGMVTEPLESVIILRDIVGFSEKRDYEMSPAAKAGAYYFQAAKSAYERAFGDKEELTRKDIRNMIDAIGVTIPFPTGQVWKSAEYFLDWMAGNEEPGNAAEGLWRTLVTGKRK